MMDDRMVEYLAREMRAHDENRQEQGHDRLGMPAVAADNNNNVNNPRNDNVPLQDANEHRNFENLRHVDELDHDEATEEHENNDSDGSLPSGDDSSRIGPGSSNDHEEDEEGEGQQQQQQPEEEADYRDHIDPNPMDMWANRRAQNEFDDLIAAQQLSLIHI